LKLFERDENTIEISDRGFAKAPGLIATRKTDAHFLVRMSPNYLALQDRAGNKFDVVEQLRSAVDADSLSVDVVMRYANTGETCDAYLHAHRLSEQASNKARRRAKRTSKRTARFSSRLR